MRKLLILTFIVLAHIGCVETLFAQGLPRVVTVTWDANAPAENITSYDVVLDTGAAIPIVPTASPTAQVSVATAGHHVIAVIAKSVTLACDDPTQCNTIQVTSSAPATVGFTISAGASPVKNTKIK